MKSSHEEKMKAISSKLNQSPENVFDMKKLEQELFAIQKGGAVGDPSVSEPPLEDDDDEDDGDPFNRFWGVVEPMVNKLSQAPSPGQPAAMSDTVFDEAEINRIQHEMSFIDDSFFTCPTQSHQDQTTYTQSDQNPVIKAMPDPNDNPEEENRALKAQIADIKSEIQSLQQVRIHTRHGFYTHAHLLNYCTHSIEIRGQYCTKKQHYSVQKRRTQASIASATDARIGHDDTISHDDRICALQKCSTCRNEHCRDYEPHSRVGGSKQGAEIAE